METSQYNSRLWPTSVAAGSVYSLALGYSGTGDIISANDSVNGNFNNIAYDYVHRLGSASAQHPLSGCYGLNWSYDYVGNRTAQSVGLNGGTCPTSSLDYNTNNQIITPSGYQYDAAGNMTNDTTHTYAYDAEGRMLAVDSGSTATYVYDAFGRRIEKTTASGSLVYSYDPAGQQVAEVDGSGKNVEDDIWAGSRHLAMYYSNSTYFFNSDQVTGTAPMRSINRGGSCCQDRPERVATDPTGTVAQTCTNFQYGDDHICTGSLPTGFFAGYVFDSETVLYHSPARYYSPALGRLMTPDPVLNRTMDLQSLNRFAFVRDNPAILVDPTGKWRCISSEVRRERGAGCFSVACWAW